MKGTLLLGICTFLIITASNGQVKYTKLSGKITDVTNGTPLVGASIILENSKAGVKTDVEGNFFITAEVGKKYNLQVSNIGYVTKVLNGIQVNGTENDPLTVNLERESSSLNLYVVRSTARRESVASIYSAQKNSSSISDAISAESIKKSPDRTTSEVLRRVSGTSIQDNKFVIIRGLSERYNASLLNNSVLPSTEPDKKAFSFDIIPSALIDNITIYKSPTPDLPGDFAGGTIKISTKDYPSRKLSEVSLNIGYNSLTTFKNFYKGTPDGKLDNLGFFDNSRLIPGSYYRNRGAGFINLGNDQKLAITKQFPNTFGYQSAYQSQPNIGLSYTGGNTTVIGNNKFGYIYSLNYSTGRRVSERTRQEYETYNVLDYNYNTINYDTRNTLSGLLNLTYSYRKSKISLKNLFNNDFVKTEGIRNGINTINTSAPFYYKSSNTEATGNGIESSVLEGLHSLSKGWTIDWNGSFSTTYRWQPDQKILTFHTDPGSQAYYLSLSNENSPDIINAGRVYSYLTERIYGANLNIAKQFNWLGQSQKLKLGTANYYRDRNVEVNALGYASLNAGFGTLKIPESKTTTFNSIFSSENLDANRIVLANIGTNSTDYTGTGLLNAGYAMLDNKFSDKIKLTWGVRIEKYLQKLNASGKNEIKLDNTDVLPSFLFTYSLNSKTNIRVAASEGVNRPEFRELATYRVYDYENNFIIQGNNNLKRSKNSNIDLRYEWFPAAGEIISASVFYKYFKQPIEQTNLGNDVLSFDNADNSTVYGIELELRKKLDFLNSNFFDHLVFYTNAAYIKGSVKFNGVTINSPMQGQSPYLINGGISYSTDNDKLSFNVLYNRIGPRLKFRAASGAGKDIFEKPRDVMDFQVSKKFLNNRLELKLTLSDLFAQPYTWYYKYQSNPSNVNYKSSEDRIVNTYKYGTSASVGLRFNFSK